MSDQPVKKEVQFRSDVVCRRISSMGGDESIIQAMLVSSDKSSELFDVDMDEPANAGRIKFLMKNRHGTPFEHNSIRFYVEAPIFVFREWHRHRIGWSYNEQSGRYSELPPMFYIPPEERPLVQVGKPGAYEYVAGDKVLYAWTTTQMKSANRHSYYVYQHLLEEGVAKEVARMVLPVNIYSKMYATCNARSLMAFLSLRTNEPPYNGATGTGAMFPSKPMWEIEQAARMAEEVFKELFPVTYSAWNEYGRVCP